MKSVLKILLITVFTVLPAVSSALTCPQKKAVLLREINGGIATFPASCRTLTILQCGILFNTKLPQLRGVITTNQHDKLHLVVQGVNENLETIRGIIADEYAAPMNTLIRDLNIYNAQCAK